MRFGPKTATWKIAAAIALVCMATARVAVPQSGTRGTPVTIPSASSSSGSRPAYTNPNLIPMPGMDLTRDDDPSFRVMRQNARRDDIKKHMQQNAQRLLLLTIELRADLETREPTEADSKRLDDIAKLAHAVREQMKQ